MSQAFSFVSETTYCASFYLNSLPYLIEGKTFLGDAQITQSLAPSSVTTGFTYLVNNYGPGYGICIKELFQNSNCVVNFYHAYTNWYDGINVYTYETSLPTIYCILRFSVIG